MRPTIHISGTNIVVWGVILMLHSVGTSFGAFFALRFLLGGSEYATDDPPVNTHLTGMCESCVAPILILIISMFYKKNEQVIDSNTSADFSNTDYIGHTDLMVLCHGMRNVRVFRGMSKLTQPQNGVTSVFGGFVAFVCCLSAIFCRLRIIFGLGNFP
jgi:hypothetical protein